MATQVSARHVRCASGQRARASHFATGAACLPGKRVARPAAARSVGPVSVAAKVQGQIKKVRASPWRVARARECESPRAVGLLPTMRTQALSLRLSAVRRGLRRRLLLLAALCAQAARLRAASRSARCTCAALRVS